MMNDASARNLAQALQVRQSLARKHGEFMGLSGHASVGRYVANYLQCAVNRMIDIHDDATFLLEHGRVGSACAIGRAMIETYGIVLYFGEQLHAALAADGGMGGVEECSRIVLKFTNSSRIKETEQKKLQKDVFQAEDYEFTEQALHRMRNGLATSEHVMKALRALYATEMKERGGKESTIEMTYDMLSEWVHPSQTSIFHQYVPATHAVETSMGTVQLLDAARAHCAQALVLIVNVPPLLDWIGDIVTALETLEARAQLEPMLSMLDGLRPRA